LHVLELVGQEEKLSTVVDDDAPNFSIGQCQCLCLAGSISINPMILLLGGVTTSVDAISDALSQKAMRATCLGATILSITCRLSDQVLKEWSHGLGYPVICCDKFAAPRADFFADSLSLSVSRIPKT
jgi:ABC-type transport system involved in cytochrome bd biosynthesis fused ATPase/permease subunit